MDKNKGAGMQNVFLPLFIYMGITLLFTLLIDDLLYSVMMSAIAGIWIFGNLYRKDQQLYGVGYTKVRPIEYLWPALLGVSSCLVSNNLLDFGGIVQMTPEIKEMMTSFYRGNVPVELVTLGILTPLSEELLFRGVIYKRTKRMISAKNAAVVANLIFAMNHGSMIQGLYAFLSGLLICYVYERYQTLLAPLLFHMGANLLSVLASETEVLKIMYTGKTTFLAVTFTMAIILVFAVYMIEVRVHVREIVEDGTGETKEKVNLE